jgi:hypothetical protein
MKLKMEKKKVELRSKEIDMVKLLINKEIYELEKELAQLKDLHDDASSDARMKLLFKYDDLLAIQMELTLASIS